MVSAVAAVEAATIVASQAICPAIVRNPEAAAAAAAVAAVAGVVTPCSATNARDMGISPVIAVHKKLIKFPWVMRQEVRRSSHCRLVLFFQDRIYLF